MRQTYLIINAFSARNAGDAAIVLATAAVLRENGEAQICSATRYFEQDRQYYAAHDIEVVPPIVPFAPRPEHGHARQRVLTLLAGTLAAFLIVFLSRLTPSGARGMAKRLTLEGLAELLAADRVIVCGGGYLFSARRALNLTLLHTTVSTKLAQLAGKSPLMMPQSIGPLPRRLDRMLVSWGFSKVRPIVVRDEFALSEARKVISSKPEELELCPDIAFAGWPSSPVVEDPATTFVEDPATTERKRAGSVGIVAMDWTWARGVHQGRDLDAYVAKLAAVARDLSARGFEVRLYGHSRIAEMNQDDISVAQRIAHAAGEDANVRVELLESTGDVTELCRRFASLSVLIGTRLHSCIIAMSAGTPAIGLAYQPKSVGTFRMLSLEEYCFDVESFEVDRVVQIAAELAEDGAAQSDVVVERVAAAKDRIQTFYARHLP